MQVNLNGQIFTLMRSLYTSFLRGMLIVLLAGVQTVVAGDVSSPDAPTEAELDYIRGTFYKSVENKLQAELLSRYIVYRFSEETDRYEPTVLAYSGATDALHAKHSLNPFLKLRYVRTSLRKLHRSVAESPDDVEIRFLRFAVLHNLPSFLGYGELLIEDRDKICELLFSGRSYLNIEDELFMGVLDFLLSSGRLTELQLQNAHEHHRSISGNEHVPTH